MVDEVVKDMEGVTDKEIEAIKEVTDDLVVKVSTKEEAFKVRMGKEYMSIICWNFSAI